MGFEALLGNDRLKENLTAGISKGRISHFYLISGPQGSGKKTLARLLAAAILCKSPQKPCFTCPACRKVMADTHPDLITVRDPEHKNVAVKIVRQIREDVFIRPNEADRKVYLFPQDLGIEGQNALLKVLEEPATSVFVLLCENREAMLQTVRSRCKTFRLAPLSERDMLAALQTRSDAPIQELQQAAAHSGGLLGRALDMLSGREKAGQAAARAFCHALSGDELTVWLACQDLTKLTREDYADFCDESCRLLIQTVRRTGDRRCLDIFEYLEKQRSMLRQNPSLTALAGALAAFCGKTV